MMDGGEKRAKPGRDRSRARSVEFDRETDIRESMPHRREKDKTWWEDKRERERERERERGV